MEIRRIPNLEKKLNIDDEVGSPPRDVVICAVSGIDEDEAVSEQLSLHGTV